MDIKLTRDEVLTLNNNQLELFTAAMLGWTHLLPAGARPAHDEGVLPLKGTPPGGDGVGKPVPNFVEDEGEVQKVRSFIDGRGLLSALEDHLREMFGSTPDLAAPDELCRAALYAHVCAGGQE